MLLQGAAVRVACALWSWRGGAGQVLLQGAAVRAVRAFWSWIAGAAARCRCRVLPSECGVRCLAWVLAPFKGVAAVEPCGLTESITFTPCQKGSVFGCCPKICIVILGLCWRNQF